MKNRITMNNTPAIDFKKTFYVLGTIGLLLALMVVGRRILIPVSLAILFAALLSPVVNYLVSKKWPEALAIVTAMLGLIIVAGGIITLLTVEIINIARDLPDFSERLTAVIASATTSIQEYYPAFEMTSDWRSIVANQIESGAQYVLDSAGDIGNKLLNVILIPVFIVLFLIYRKMPVDFIDARFSGGNYKRSAKQIFGRVRQMVTQFLVGSLWFTLATGVMSFIILLSVGSDYVLFFSIVIALLNLLPYIGTIIAFVIVITYQFIAMDGIFLPILTWFLLWVSNLIQENALRPWLVGRSTRINALAILLSVIIGSMIWGVAGMIVFIPLVGIIKIVMEAVPELKPYAVFFTDKK